MFTNYQMNYVGIQIKRDPIDKNVKRLEILRDINKSTISSSVATSPQFYKYASALRQNENNNISTNMTKFQSFEQNESKQYKYQRIKTSKTPQIQSISIDKKLSQLQELQTPNFFYKPQLQSPKLQFLFEEGLQSINLPKQRFTRTFGSMFEDASLTKASRQNRQSSHRPGTTGNVLSFKNQNNATTLKNIKRLNQENNKTGITSQNSGNKIQNHLDMGFNGGYKDLKNISENKILQIVKRSSDLVSIISSQNKNNSSEFLNNCEIDQASQKQQLIIAMPGYNNMIKLRTQYAPNSFVRSPTLINRRKSSMITQNLGNTQQQMSPSSFKKQNTKYSSRMIRGTNQQITAEVSQYILNDINQRQYHLIAQTKFNQNALHIQKAWRRYKAAKLVRQLRDELDRKFNRDHIKNLFEEIDNNLQSRQQQIKLREEQEKAFLILQENKKRVKFNKINPTSILVESFVKDTTEQQSNKSSSKSLKQEQYLDNQSNEDSKSLKNLLNKNDSIFSMKSEIYPDQLAPTKKGLLGISTFKKNKINNLRQSLQQVAQSPSKTSLSLKNMVNRQPTNIKQSERSDLIKQKPLRSDTERSQQSIPKQSTKSLSSSKSKNIIHSSTQNQHGLLMMPRPLNKNGIEEAFDLKQKELQAKIKQKAVKTYEKPRRQSLINKKKPLQDKLKVARPSVAMAQTPHHGVGTLKSFNWSSALPSPSKSGISQTPQTPSFAIKQQNGIQNTKNENSASHTSHKTSEYQQDIFTAAQQLQNTQLPKYRKVFFGKNQRKNILLEQQKEKKLIKSFRGKKPINMWDESIMGSYVNRDNTNCAQNNLLKSLGFITPKTLMETKKQISYLKDDKVFLNQSIDSAKNIFKKLTRENYVKKCQKLLKDESVIGQLNQQSVKIKRRRGYLNASRIPKNSQNIYHQPTFSAMCKDESSYMTKFTDESMDQFLFDDEDFDFDDSQSLNQSSDNTSSFKIQLLNKNNINNGRNERSVIQESEEFDLSHEGSFSNISNNMSMN